MTVKAFVLDTNVLLHSAQSIESFHDNDVVIPMAVVEELDIHSSRRVVERVEHRTLVADTDDGADIRRRVEDLEQLLEAYRDGQIAEGGR